MSDLPKVVPSAPLEPPETAMLWRRLITTAVVGVVFALIWHLVDRIPPGQLAGVVRWLLVFALVSHLTYLTGASMVDWLKIVAAVRARRDDNALLKHLGTDASTGDPS